MSARCQPAASRPRLASHERPATAASPPRASRSRAARDPASEASALAELVDPRRAQHAAAPVGHQLGRAARGDRHDRQPGRLRLEDHLAERIGLRAEQEQVGRRVRSGQRIARRASPGTSPSRRAARAARPPRGRRRPAADAAAGRARGRRGTRRPAGRAPFSRVRRPAYSTWTRSPSGSQRAASVRSGSGRRRDPSGRSARRRPRARAWRRRRRRMGRGPCRHWP